MRARLFRLEEREQRGEDGTQLQKTLCWGRGGVRIAVPAPARRAVVSAGESRLRPDRRRWILVKLSRVAL